MTANPRSEATGFPLVSIEDSRLPSARAEHRWPTDLGIRQSAFWAEAFPCIAQFGITIISGTRPGCTIRAGAVCPVQRSVVPKREQLATITGGNGFLGRANVSAS